MKLCVLFCFLYSFFSHRLCLGGGGSGFEGVASLLWQGPDAGLAGGAVPETGKCLEAHPQDLLFVFRLWHWLLQHLHFYTIMSLTKQYTEKKNLLPVFFLFTYVKKNGTKFQMDVLCFRNTQGVIKRVFLHMLSLLSNCSRRCGSVHTSSFPTKTISFACVYIDIVGRLLS